MTIAKNIKELREFHGLTQDELGKICGAPKISGIGQMQRFRFLAAPIWLAGRGKESTKLEK